MSLKTKGAFWEYHRSRQPKATRQLIQPDCRLLRTVSCERVAVAEAGSVKSITIMRSTLSPSSEPECLPDSTSDDVGLVEELASLSSCISQLPRLETNMDAPSLESERGGDEGSREGLLSQEQGYSPSTQSITREQLVYSMTAI